MQTFPWNLGRHVRGAGRQHQQLQHLVHRSSKSSPLQAAMASTEHAKRPAAAPAADAADADAQPTAAKKAKPATADADADVGAGGARDQQAPAGERHSEPLPDGVLETGRVFFLYKPKVAASSVSSLDNVQRFYLLLQPLNPATSRCRLLVVGKKRLPSTTSHERFFTFVEAVGDSPSELTGGLTEQHYSTATRGERLQGAVRAAGEGPYVISRGGGRGSGHLAYSLELPADAPGEAQEVLGIQAEGSFVLSAKNPANKGRGGAPSAGPQPSYSEEQEQLFGSNAWVGISEAAHVSLLDVPGTELLLIGAKADPIETGELGAGSDLLAELAEQERQALWGDAEGAEGDTADLQANAEALLLEALEPAAEAAAAEGGGSGDDGAKGGGEPAIPVEPAVTGKLV